MTNATLMLFFTSIVWGCAGATTTEPPLDEAEVSERFEAFLSDKRSCTEDEHCVLVSCGCPTGCGSAVAKSERDAVYDYACELVDDYEQNGRSCDYSCVQAYPVCISGVCTEVTQ